MSNGYIGTYPKLAIYAPEKLAKGTTTKTLQYAPGSAYAILVVVGGAIQEPNVAYTVAGNVITFTETLPYDGWVQYRGLEGKDATDFIAAAGDPVLSARWSWSRANIWDGFVASDGQELSRALYPSAWEAIEAGKVPVVDDAVWLSDPLSRGCFTKGNGTTTFRVPDLNGKSSGAVATPFLRGDGVNTSGNNKIQPSQNRDHTHLFQSASNGAVPNWGKNKEYLDFNSGAGSAGSAPDNKYIQVSKATEDMGGAAWNGTTNLGVRLSSQGTTESRPDNLSGCWMIKLFAAISHAGVADLQQVLVTLAGKMDKTKYEFGVPMIGVPFYWPSDKMPDEVYPELKGMHFIQARGDNFDAGLYPKLATVYPTNKLPDLRGEFIRGWDDGRDVDTGRALLTSQEHAAISHNHGIPTKVGSAVNIPYGIEQVISDENIFSSAKTVGVDYWSNSERVFTYTTGGRNGAESVSSPDASSLIKETRPRNVAYNIIVRAL